MRRSRVAGFTLVELLVVIAIIGVLISLLLPALQIAREAARKSQCQNNLKQLTLAVLNYEHNYNVFPPSGLVGRPAGERPEIDGSPRKNGYVEYIQKSGYQFSWICLTLPFFEQQALHKQFDFNRSVMDQKNGDPQATNVASLNCPSDHAEGRFLQDLVMTRRKPFAKGNYAAYCSPFHTELQNWYPGALVGHIPQTRRRFRDGFSSTIMLSEVRTRDGRSDERGTWALPWNGASLLAYDSHAIATSSDLRYQRKHRYVVDSQYVSTSSQPPNNEGPNFDITYDCRGGDLVDAVFSNMPCRQYGDRDSQTGALFLYWSAAARSLHPGGVFVSWCDGRVTFLNNNVDREQMAYMISIDDGQPLSLSE